METSTLVHWMVEISAVGAEAIKAATAGVMDIIKAADTQIKAMQKDTEDVAEAVKDAVAGMASPQATVGLQAFAKYFGDGKIAAEAAAIASKTASAVAEQLTKKLAEQATAVKAVGVAFAGYAVGLLGVVRAGMSGTVELQRLQFSMSLLTREVAGVFKPAIDAVINAVRDATIWFRNLTGDNQTMIRNVAAGVLAFGGMAIVLPKIAAGLATVKVAMTAISAHPLIAAAAAIAAVASSSESGRKALGELFDAVMKVGEAMMPIFNAAARVIVVVADLLAPLIELFAKIVEAIGPAWGVVIAYYAVSAALTSATASMGGFTAIAISGMTASAIATNILTASMIGLGNAIRGALSATGIGLLLVGLGALVSWLMKEEMPEIPDPRSGSRRERSQLSLAGGGFEGFEATWTRIQGGINAIDLQRRTADAAEQTARNTRDIALNTRQQNLIPPASGSPAGGFPITSTL